MPLFRKGREISQPRQEEREAMVLELRASVNGLGLSRRASYFCTDACLLRYLRITGWSLKKSLSMLQETIRWRDEYKPENIKWVDVVKEAHSGKLYKANFSDKEGRPVLVSYPTAQKAGDFEGEVKLLVYFMENAIMNLADGQEQLGMLVNLSEWSIRATSMSLAQASAHVLQAHYPQGLAYSIYYNPPRVFGAFFSMIKPFLSSELQKTIHFVYPKDVASMASLERFFDMDQLESSFGGRSEWRFEATEYGKLMEQDDSKRMQAYAMIDEASRS